VVVDEKVRAFVKTFKTYQIHELALPRAFPGQKHALAHAFRNKYDQNYGLRAREGDADKEREKEQCVGKHEEIGNEADFKKKLCLICLFT
jgi:hypothetical protein